MNARGARLRPVGDRAFLVTFPPDIDPDTSARVRALDRVLAARPDVAETVPGFSTVLVILSGGADRARFIREWSEERETSVTDRSRGDAAADGKSLTVPVVYGGGGGPDLDEVGRRAGLSPQAVIESHLSREYLVYMVGFAPGFPYLGVLPDNLHLPRRATPRTRVPAGSVAIADRLTGVYPRETPGGWHVIGWTPLSFFDARKEPPALCAAGDRVRFVLASGHDSILPPAARAAQEPEMAAPRRPVLSVREPGLVATAQDPGRFGYRRLGVPWSGPLDPREHALANGRAGNPPDAATLEMTWPAPVFDVLDEVVCALAGPGWQATVDGHPADPGAPLPLRRRQVLGFRREGKALWAYLAVEGGVDVPLVLGSRATLLRGGFGGVEGRALRAGDVLGRGAVADRPRRLPPSPVLPEDPLMIRLIPGPQEAHFAAEGLHRLLGETYAVTVQIDRAGYRLAGPMIPHAAPAEILPEGVLPGAVQVPGDGQPIVLMADGPTTGGYPKIGTVPAADLGRLAQAGPGTRVRFRAVTVTALGEEV